MADLIQNIRKLASNDNLSKTQLDTVAKVRIFLPNSENKILQGSDLNIVDLPGIENYYWASKIESYMDKHQNTIIPLFIIDLTQGGFDLAQFEYVKNLFKNSHGLKIPFVFTKFSNMINGVITTMEVSGTPLADLPDEQ